MLISLFVAFDTREDAVEFTDWTADKYGCDLWVYHIRVDGDPVCGSSECWRVSYVEWDNSECVYSRVIAEPETQDMFAVA